MTTNKNLKKLPIGIQTFSEIREENYVYVDKTGIALDLIENGKYYFLSRPRRFGKSLFVDTLKCIFEGKKELFTGLAIENAWDWSQKHPVISISFAGGVTDSRRLLEERILNALQILAEQFDVTPRFDNIADRFEDLIRQVREKTDQKVVILVDEYDKPILDNITHPEIAAQLRECLKDLYSVIKAQDDNIRFVFITGVSKFSKVSIFSGLNNLDDITLDPKYSTLCGYTQKDLEQCFGEHLQGYDLKKIKQWYNGYNWLGEHVYNPFDILLFISKGYKFRNYWFETGTPTFLIKLIESGKYFTPAIETIHASEELIGSFDIEEIAIETLLFQAGYLTIDRETQVADDIIYILKYPNKEVKKSLTDYLLSQLSQNRVKKQAIKSDLYDALCEMNLDALPLIFHSFFASIPHDWYRKNNLSGYEGYYASIFYCYFASLGLDVTPEDTTNHGRIDMTLKMDDAIFIFEFKVVELVKEENSALEQIKAKRYHEKYETSGDVYLVGVEFSKEDRNIVGYEWEKVLPRLK
ncbi:ATP-binding protein [Desulfoluna sp.]|uniref:ATP-binding protein n=1 Tax=Desulfoluna sp. TaxID=2045199 RepID=UPI0026287644|nr:ATP-binding protein [Desulfoluna sp.]